MAAPSFQTEQPKTTNINIPISNNPFTQELYDEVIYVIDHSKEIPGLKSDEFAKLKEGLRNYANDLVKTGSLNITDTDEKIRPYFVGLQAIFEHVLATKFSQKKLTSLTGIIDTPMPATPLCTKGEITKGLVDPQVENDPKRLVTVEARATIIRNFLFLGGDLFVVYPQGGLEKRSNEQQKIYQETREDKAYKDHLLDHPLNTPNPIPEDLIGAVYFFTHPDGKVYVFAIQMTQANDIKAKADFGLWFGPIENPKIQKRASNVVNFIQQNSKERINLPLSVDKFIKS